MNFKKLFKIFVIVLFLGGSYVVYSSSNNGSLQLLTQVQTVIDTVSFPFKIAALAAESPVTELPVPVEGVRLYEVVDTWGAPRPTGRGHNGTDIFAARGTPIFSATKGYVRRMGVSNLGGNHIFITGPGGVRYYYAHLDTFADGIDIGSEVSTTTIIGTVGNTGNANTTPPHLHFGIYTNGAQNPFPLLVERDS